MPFAEYVDLNEDAVKRGMYRLDRRVFLPGMAWYQPFYFDPRGELKKMKREGFREDAMFSRRQDDARPFLSVHYWNTWSSLRPPIAVVCPDGNVWEIDRKSSNGSGWVVTGDAPNITCSPSIVVANYHGFLRNGEFTADLEGRTYQAPVV